MPCVHLRRKLAALHHARTTLVLGAPKHPGAPDGPLVQLHQTFGVAIQAKKRARCSVAPVLLIWLARKDYWGPPRFFRVAAHGGAPNCSRDSVDRTVRPAERAHHPNCSGSSEARNDCSSNEKGPPLGDPCFCMARPEGFEPPTTWFVARYSIQLSYGRVGSCALCGRGYRVSR